MKISMRVDGGAQLARELNALPRRVARPVLRGALTAGAEPIRRAMAATAPRAPGPPDLADHMVISNTRVEGLLENDKTAAVAVGPEREFYYGFFQEVGTADHAAQPFARPGFDQGAAQAVAIIARELWTALAARGVVRREVMLTTPDSDGRFL